MPGTMDRQFLWQSCFLNCRFPYPLQSLGSNLPRPPTNNIDVGLVDWPRDFFHSMNCFRCWTTSLLIVIVSFFFFLRFNRTTDIAPRFNSKSLIFDAAVSETRRPVDNANSITIQAKGPLTHPGNRLFILSHLKLNDNTRICCYILSC